MRSAIGFAIAAASVSVASNADAATCAGRPTDPGGTRGYSYGAAEMRAFDAARVRVHYAMTGPHAPDSATTRGDAVPDSVAVAGEVGDKALAKYAEMGFKAPPGDGACASDGGDDKIDIYLVAFAGADGVTARDACNGLVCSSYVLVDSTFTGRSYATPADGFRTVVSHELFHAVQNAYASEADPYWSEGTAQWAMKTVYPDLADFEKQLPAFFKENKRSLDFPPSGVTAGFLYGAGVWPLFLTLRHGPDTVRSVFEHMTADTSSIAATDAALVAAGSSLADDYPLFGAWNAATGALAAAGGYPDAAAYPGVKTEPLADGVTAITSGLPYFVYRGTLDGPSKISLETDAARNAGVVVPFEDGKPALAKAAKLPANSEGEVLVVVAGVTSAKTDAPFTLRIGAPDGTLPAPGTPPSAETAPTTTASSSSGGCVASAPSAARTRGTNPLLALSFALLGIVWRRRTRRACGTLKCATR